MRIIKKLLVLLLVILVLAGGVLWWLTRPVPALYSLEETSGTDPLLAEPDPQLIPTVGVSAPIGWGDDGAPQAAEGLVVNRFAEGLEHPRVIYTMPGGDVLVTLTNAPDRPITGGWLTNMVAGFLFSRAGAAVPSPNQVVLLRDADGDGTAEERHVLIEGLDSPSGLAWHDGNLYVANHDEVLRFDYAEGANTVAGAGEKLMDLPAAGNHWMRNLLLNPEGTLLYIAVGSASNIGEGGMEIERDRAAIHELDLVTGRPRLFSDGLRNPNGLAWNPWSGELWTTVNERDQLGSDLVPDYLTNVPLGSRYGWPWVYYGDVIDERVEHPMEQYFTQYTRVPEFALGAHVAALGLTFTQEGSRMGPAFAQGAFIARHGSWNRVPASGYDVVFVEFDARGNPLGKPVTVLESFLAGEGETHGRPTWVAWDRTGALLVSDDTANIIWRVVNPSATGAAAPARNRGARLPPRRELVGDPARAFEDPPADIMPDSL
ncbi:MAG TPA: sorbosone dehydrogenase family protein [Paracoccaceae bacterium]|nr:sorbosone dehydrogenase family protein [Paracoccaceae bacterium]